MLSHNHDTKVERIETNATNNSTQRLGYQQCINNYFVGSWKSVIDDVVWKHGHEVYIYCLI